MAIKNWLSASLARHGDTTSKSSKPTATKGTAAPSPKVKATADKTTDMKKTAVQGESKGGGKSSISNGDAPTDGKTKTMKGLMGGPMAVKANQKRGSY
ncbi:hypothetical protein [Paraburkholderia terrae]|uniref:hypothetical protein n=1 Tax=Paraburkholderia terrae TaxID=311230 RepID=UPI0020453953|nr:hypothetical protein [Paraburkholderia terrae]BDC37910.1 hypothetical protein PTKU15_12070 [Paraburkholderia terrae]